MATIPFNVQHQVSSISRHAQPYPNDDGTSSRQVPNREHISQLKLWPTLDAIPDPVTALRTSAIDSNLEDLLRWNPASRRTCLSNQISYPCSSMDPHKSTSLVNWDMALSEDELLWGTLEQPPSSGIPSSTASRVDDLQSNPGFLPHLAPSTSFELRNQDLHLGSLSNMGYHFLGLSEMGAGECVQTATLPDSLLANPHSSNISHGPNEWPLDQASLNSLKDDQGDVTAFLYRTESYSNIPNCGQDQEDFWYHSTDFGYQPDMLDDYSQLQPARVLETSQVPPSLAASSTGNSPLSPLWPIGVTQDFGTWRLPDTSPKGLSEPAQAALGSSTMPDESEGLHIKQLKDKAVYESENTTAIKTQPVKMRRLLEPLNWQHISSTELKPHETIKDIKHPRKTAGRRRGPLRTETAKSAHQMRHLRACLPCSILKIKCTPGDVCKRCSKRSTPSLAKRICTRSHLDDYTDLFFPGPFVSHFELAAVEELSRELSLGFIDIDAEVDFTCGCGYPPMKLAVSEFIPSSKNLPPAPTINTRSLDRVPSFQYQYPPPIASTSAFADLIETCRSHIKLVVMHQRDLRSPVAERGSKLSKMVLEAIIRYHGSASSPSNLRLLDKAMMLDAIYYFMGTTLTITDISKKYVGERLRRPTMQSYDSNLISRLLNRQIKSAMHALRREVMREVLEELEKELKTKSKAAWATCFCVASILCTCVEEAQTAMDGFTMHTRIHGDESEPLSSEVTIETCRKLDDLLFSHLLELFHGVYKTHQTSKSENGGHVYNPIRDRPEKDIKEGIDHESARLMIDIRQIIANHDRDIAERATRPPCGRTHDNLAQHMAFREGSSARLVSSFLKSFHFT